MGHFFVLYHIMTSYGVSITEQTMAKCYLFVNYTCINDVLCYILYMSLNCNLLEIRNNYSDL